MTKARTIADFKFENIVDTGTEGTKIASGTTAQRGSTTGQFRFNSTTGLAEYYNGLSWSALETPPAISSISPSSFDAAGDTITITGSNFQTGANVIVVGNNGTEYTPASVTRNSSTEITFDTTQTILDSESDLFDIKVTNTSGLSATTQNALEISDGTFSWNSSATSTLYDSSRSSGFNAGGSLSGGGGESDVSISSYAVSSGSLPAGGSLNTSTGLVTGISAVGSDTNSTFTITATVSDTSAGNTTYTREFTLTVAAPVTQTFSYTGSDQTFNIPAGVTAVQVYMWGAAGGGARAEGYDDAGGPGGYSDGLIDVSGMSSLEIQVGSGGGISTSNGTVRPSRPYPNAGLPSLRSGYFCGAGGGRSAIFNSSVSFANALIVAGGGGGAAGHGGGSGNAGNGTHGGSGGGSSGTDGSSSNSGVGAGGDGGTQSAGGATTSGVGRPLGRAGGQLQGSDAGDGQLWNTGFNSAGGGGDGYYGGGTIDDVQGGGGGGSGYLHPSLVSSGQTLVTTSPSGKQTTISPPQTGSSYYSAGIGQGNSYAAGGNGKVVLVY